MRSIFLVKSQSAILDSVISRFFFFDNSRYYFLVYKKYFSYANTHYSLSSQQFSLSSAVLRYWVRSSDAGKRCWEIASKIRENKMLNDQLITNQFGLAAGWHLAVAAC